MTEVKHIARARLASEHGPIALITDVGELPEILKQILQGEAVVVLIPSTAQRLLALLSSSVRQAAVTPMSDNALVLGKLCIQVRERRVLWQDEEIRVSPQELGILQVLALDPGCARSFEELASSSSRSYVGDKEAVKSAVKRLRRKLVRAIDEIRIDSVPGFGYRLSIIGCSSPDVIRIDPVSTSFVP